MPTRAQETSSKQFVAGSLAGILFEKIYAV